MMFKPPETTVTWSDGQALKASRLYRDGLIAGTLGAVTLALWFLLLDLLQGSPLYTPNVLGTALFHGGVGLDMPAQLPIAPGRVIAFTGVHWLAFAVIGVAASWLLGLAERNPNLGFGVLLLFVLFEGGFLGAAMMFAEPVLHALAWKAVLIGNLLAAVAMGGYLWRRHAHMAINP
jgi:hypothetical protein